MFLDRLQHVKLLATPPPPPDNSYSFYRITTVEGVTGFISPSVGITVTDMGDNPVSSIIVGTDYKMKIACPTTIGNVTHIEDLTWVLVYYTFKRVEEIKEIKGRGSPSVLSFFIDKFNKYHNTRALMLESFYPLQILTQSGHQHDCWQTIR